MHNLLSYNGAEQPHPYTCTDYRYKIGSIIESYSYTEARAHLAELWNHVISERAAVTLHRRGAEPVVVLPAAEYEGLLETAYLLRSPANAERLLTALRRAEAAEGTPATIDELRAEIALDP